jgi:D-alanine-D-alanine ligase-like ATP-grasp enzyme
MADGRWAVEMRCGWMRACSTQPLLQRRHKCLNFIHRQSTTLPHNFARASTDASAPRSPNHLFSLSDGRLHPETNRAFRRAFGSYSGPFIVKPVNGRASQNVEFVPSIDGLEAMVAQVFAATGCLILVEQYLGGREYCVAVAGGGPTGGGLAFSAVERVLGAGERVFTSMDVKAITGDRVRALDATPGSADAAVANQLFSLARAVYEDLSLTALVRLDIRADDKGRLHILEANPKPDLARPKAGSAVTSMVAAGLPALGWSYEDLIAFLLVERLWQLQTKRPEVLAHFMPAGSNGDELIRALPCRIASVLGATPAPAAPLEVRELRKALSAALVRASSLQLREEGAVEGAGRFSGGSFTGGGFPFARTCDLGAASFTYA